MPFRPILYFCVLQLSITLPFSTHAKPLEIVTDIGPVQAIANAISAGIQVPDQLISGNVSSHDFTLKPSDIHTLKQADVIIWLGPQATPGLAKLMQVPELADKAIALNKLSVTRLHPVRNSGVATVTDDRGLNDPHTWLDPENGLAWAESISGLLQGLDPENSSAYQSNFDSFAYDVRIAKQKIRSEIATAAPIPFFQYHDAFQYFEVAFGLSPRGFATTGDATVTSLGVLSQIRTDLKNYPQSCVFTPPEQQDNASHVFEGIAGVKIAVIDPNGLALGKGYTYPALLNDMAAGFIACLFRPS